MIWQVSHRADPRARELADRHYNRQKVGSPQFVPPGRCCVLYAETDAGKAFWVTSWPFAEYVRHAWAGAWVCSAFRNEGAGTSSEMIVQALAATRFVFGDPPELGLISFIDERKVKPTIVRGKPIFGWTWFRAGAVVAGRTKGGLLAVQFCPSVIPPAMPAIGMQGHLIVGGAQ